MGGSHSFLTLYDNGKISQNI